MKPGELRRFKEGPYDLYMPRFEGSTFMVLRVHSYTEGETWRWLVDILLDSKREEDLGYNWVMEGSEVISEAG